MMIQLGLTTPPIIGQKAEIQRPSGAALQDFVTAEAVSEAVAGGAMSRLPVSMGELALSSSVDDFAGTALVSRA